MSDTVRITHTFTFHDASSSSVVDFCCIISSMNSFSVLFFDFLLLILLYIVDHDLVKNFKKFCYYFFVKIVTANMNCSIDLTIVHHFNSVLAIDDAATTTYPYTASLMSTHTKSSTADPTFLVT